MRDRNEISVRSGGHALYMDISVPNYTTTTNPAERAHTIYLESNRAGVGNLAVEQQLTQGEKR
jgi:hypothetical protein